MGWNCRAELAQIATSNREKSKMEIVALDQCSSFVTKDGSIIRELLSHRNSSIRMQSLAEAVVPPGGRTQIHRHHRTEEIYWIISGTGVMWMDGHQRSIGPGDAIAIPPGVLHGLINPSNEPLRLLCCCAPGYEHEDTELLGQDG